VQAAPGPPANAGVVVPEPGRDPGEATPADRLEPLLEALERARRPVFVAGRGARGSGCREALVALAESCGALLATSAVSKGLFQGDPWDLDVSGGFATPLAVELIGGSDLIVGWGCALNMWTMRQGSLIGPSTVVAQVDLDGGAIGAHRHVDIGVVGEVRTVAVDLLARRTEREVDAVGYRGPDIRDRIFAERRWRDVPFDDTSTDDHIDPRVLTIGLDDRLDTERLVAVDSGNFMGYPSMFMSVPDEYGFCFTQAYQSIGLGLATAIGAALARPDRLTVAALGDGGFLMGIAELDTVVRLGIPMVVVVYNDDAYGAEVHHFGPDGDDLATVRFPATDLAAIGRGFGFEAVTVRRSSDLVGVESWIEGERERPLLVDAKITSDQPSWWLEEAFRGH
jgi:thiamine pyrophosphate-dependent acetolactate synthase large subunit-like protein